MSERPSIYLKKVANELADLIASGSDTDETVRTLPEQKLELLEGNSSEKQSNGYTHTSPSLTPEERVGIWKATIKNGNKYFVRDPRYQDEFGFWASAQNIPPKSMKTRILLLGESTARGFLYDPYFNPALCLSGILNKEFTPNGVEVIDLAKTNILFKEFKELCSSGLILQPDAVVIFAGNNWLNSISHSDDDVDEMLKIMETKYRFKAMKSFLEEKCRKLVVGFIQYIVTLLKEMRIPLVLVIPEFNLLDWKSNAAQRILLWSGIETGKWLELKAEANRALISGDIARAECSTREMIALNESNPLGYELMAQCKLKSGQLKEARHYLELAQDTSVFRKMNAPGIISIIRDTMREEASRYQIPVVDLPVEFNRFLSGGIPGKELFIDYCHLTDEGIRLATAFTAQKLIFLLKNKDISREKFKQIDNLPGIEVRAAAHFFAAIHNAHKGQPYENLYYHCLRAINLSRSVTDLFLNYIDMACRCIPWHLSKSFETLIESGRLSQYSALVQPTAQPIMDIDLVNAMVNALKTIGINIEDKIEMLRINEHGIQNGKINLLKSYYHLTSYHASPVVTKRYYQAFEPESSFFLVAEDSVDIKLLLTCRSPNIDSDDAQISIKVNEYDASQLNVKISRTWETHSLYLPRTFVKSGINIIKIEWALNLNFNGNQLNNKYPQKKVDLLKKMMYPVYGEIHMFSASIMACE
jgi:hypothetical protein